MNPRPMSFWVPPDAAGGEALVVYDLDTDSYGWAFLYKEELKMNPGRIARARLIKAKFDNCVRSIEARIKEKETANAEPSTTVDEP